MSYIIKNTSGLINTRMTDVGRRRLSQGKFDIAYFQIGDSEVNYQLVDIGKIVNNNILMPAFNSQNDVGTPQSNKQNVKYPYYVNGGEGNTYGIPYMESNSDSVYNSAGSKGFFSSTTLTTNGWVVETSSAYTITSNYRVDMSQLSGQTTITLLLDPTTCAQTPNSPEVNNFVTLYLDGIGDCENISPSPVLTYKIQSITTAGSNYLVTLDRNVPDYSDLSLSGNFAKAHVYPSGMTQLYDTITPQPYWQVDTLNFESPCDVINRENTLIWNMNIPWSENPAGLFTNVSESYKEYNSSTYIGTKELLGYNENSGQTDTGEVFYYNSFDEKIVLSPSDQKTIAIIHYTNQDIDFVYGEKFATQPFDPTDPTNTTGLARNFMLSLPTIMWHKTTGTTIGLNLFIDPPNRSDLFGDGPYYIKSKVNDDMNDPGIRYYHLWDDNADEKNQLNRVGKVFPDQQIIIIDDEELVAAMSYKANRNWTLPAPKLSLIPPNTCFTNNQVAEGIMTSSNERMWVTYRFDSDHFTESLHCNYYSSINGPDTGCTPTSQNVAVRFGSEFPFLTEGSLSGFSANGMKLLCQKVIGGGRPNPTQWKMIDVTNQLTSTMNNGYITLQGLTGRTFEISLSGYNNATSYNLNNYITLPAANGQSNIMNFGEEYYFYGNLQTDITATIYQMKYLVTLNRNQFTNTSNPTWTSGTTAFINEIGLYNQEKELMIVSKLQSPQIRQGIQQFVVKLDF
jgi:hypothetical protein